jgi:hypothetical protein
MKLAREKRGHLRIAAVGLLMAALSLAGCQTTGQKDIGRQVPSGDRVVLQGGGPYARTLQTYDMTINYQYQTAGNKLKVWGTTAIKYESINELTFHLYFLDDQGRVIAIHDFYSYSDHSDFGNLKSSERQYHRDFTIPADADSFAIGYDGQTEHTADQRKFDFSYSPL